jgi:hypothetical protein
MIRLHSKSYPDLANRITVSRNKTFIISDRGAIRLKFQKRVSNHGSLLDLGNLQHERNPVIDCNLISAEGRKRALTSVSNAEVKKVTVQCRVIWSAGKPADFLQPWSHRWQPGLASSCAASTSHTRFYAGLPVSSFKLLRPNGMYHLL